MTWDWEFAWSVLPKLLNGFSLTLTVTAVAFAIALVVGLALTLVRIAGIAVVSPMTTLAVEFFRGTPLLVQLFFWFYALPTVGLSMPAIQTSIVALSIYAASFMSEVYRAGIESLPQGQIEAARVLHIPTARRWTDIILPQATAAVIPPLGNYLIAMFKYTPILAAITVPEVMFTALGVSSQNYRFLEPVTVVGILFLAISIPSAYLMQRLERRLAAKN